MKHRREHYIARLDEVTMSRACKSLAGCRPRTPVGSCALSLCRRMNCIDARPMKFANLMAKLADERRAYSSGWSSGLPPIFPLAHARFFAGTLSPRLHGGGSAAMAMAPWPPSTRIFSSSKPVTCFLTTPISLPSGPATGSSNGLHRESNFLAIPGQITVRTAATHGA